MSRFGVVRKSLFVIAGAALLTQTGRAASTAFGGTPVSLPGTILGENFDDGGEGVAYHDWSPGNTGGAYRATDVDIETSSEGGYDIGWIGAGEWLNYTVNVTGSGSYTVALRVASPSGGTLHVGFNGPSSGTWVAVNVPSTGGYQNWTNVNVPLLLNAGGQQMTLFFDTAGINFKSATVSGGSSGTSTASGSGSTPYGGSPVQIPGHIKAENFDDGPDGVAYHDTTPGNAGGAYRNTNVDIEPSSGGGYDIAYTDPGEWLNYTVNVTSGGSYTVQLRVASLWGGSLHVGFNGPSNVWQSVSIPSTGGYQSWTTVSFPASLGGGQQQMTIMFDSGGINVDYIDVVGGGSTSSPAPAPAPTPAPPASGGGSQLVMANWNVQVDDPSAFHAQVAMDLLMAVGPRPQVVLLAEAHRSQYDTYVNELQNQTGQHWYGVFQVHCAPGGWNGSTCTDPQDEGVGLFSTYSIVDASAIYLPYADDWHSARGVVRAALNVNGTIVQVFSIHLQPLNAGARYASMSLFRSWASNFSTPQLVGGDFNADPDQIDTSAGMAGQFVDAWSVAGSGAGYTALMPNPSMKLDFSFSDSGGRAQPVSTSVVWSTGTWSDHLPVLTVFSIH
jgi:endonuclease/exonuclease/phosphatase family metal-dependent hydrolase